MKKVAIATPLDLLSEIANGGSIKEASTLPKIPHIGDKTWATVARYGQKKGQVTLSSTTQVATVKKSPVHQDCKDKSSTIASLDERLFVYHKTMSGANCLLQAPVKF